jgi:hypothetical protein
LHCGWTDEHPPTWNKRAMWYTLPLLLLLKLMTVAQYA